MAAPESLCPALLGVCIWGWGGLKTLRMPAACCPFPSIWLVPREGGVLAPAMQLTTQSASDLVPGLCYRSGAAQSFQDYSGKRNKLLCSLRQ